MWEILWIDNSTAVGRPIEKWTIHSKTFETIDLAIDTINSPDWARRGYVFVVRNQMTKELVYLNVIDDKAVRREQKLYIANCQTGELTMAARNAFEYTVILHAEPTKDNAGNDTTKDSTIVAGPKVVVAVDAEHVKRIAARDTVDLPDKDLGRIEVKVRNF